MDEYSSDNTDIRKNTPSYQTIPTIVFGFVVLVIGITIGLGIDNFSQFDTYELGEDISPKEVRNEYNYFTDGAVRCEACLVDALGPLPENWCPKGKVIKPQPFYNSDQNCYCPSPPECIK